MRKTKRLTIVFSAITYLLAAFSCGFCSIANAESVKKSSHACCEKKSQKHHSEKDDCGCLKFISDIPSTNKDISKILNQQIYQDLDIKYTILFRDIFRIYDVGLLLNSVLPQAPPNLPLQEHLIISLTLASNAPPHL